MSIRMFQWSVRTYEPDDGMNRVLCTAIALTLANLVQSGPVAYAQTGDVNGSVTEAAVTGGHTFMPDFTASSLSGPAPLTVDFRAVPTGAANASYAWNFSTFIDTPGETASFTFEESGEYAVTLKVQSGDRLRTATKIVTVTGGEPFMVRRPYTIDEGEVGESLKINTFSYDDVYTDSATTIPVGNPKDNEIDFYDLRDATDDTIAMDVFVPGIKEEVRFNARNTVLAAMLLMLNNTGAPNDVLVGFYQNFPAHPDFEALVEEVRAGKQYYNSVNPESTERLRNAAFEVAEKYLQENGLLPVGP